MHSTQARAWQTNAALFCPQVLPTLAWLRSRRATLEIPCLAPACCSKPRAVQERLLIPRWVVQNEAFVDERLIVQNRTHHTMPMTHARSEVYAWSHAVRTRLNPRRHHLFWPALRAGCGHFVQRCLLLASEALPTYRGPPEWWPLHLPRLSRQASCTAQRPHYLRLPNRLRRPIGIRGAEHLLPHE